MRLRAGGNLGPALTARHIAAPDLAPASLFKLIHGIVRKTDSLRSMRAQNMKSYVQTFESKYKK
jgi:hypothetical protein